ncbi:MAG: hypothetical protein ACHQVK_01665, partial [Candidatus Paceibacterales bacterium]
GKRFGFEFKYSEKPKTTKSMNIACDNLKLDHLYTVFPGKLRFPLSDKITACGLDSLQQLKI